MAKTQTLTFKRTINATSAEVYRALASSTYLREWFCDLALIDARRGGRFYVEWNDGYYAAGEFTAAAPGKKLAFTWNGRGDPAPTRVQVRLAEKNGRTIVTLDQLGVPAGKPGAAFAKALTKNWERALENLESAFETGEDLRISLRPMMGITFDTFDAEIAKKMGLPVDYGVRLSDTLEGMGARAAGLQKNDVIVNMAGKKVTALTLASVLQGRRAGEVVAVKYYRDKKLHTAEMLLSKRPLPDIPADPAGLAAALQKIQAEVNAELDKALAGVSEAEASARPMPAEWSAKEILCHLITGERGGQSFNAEQIDGHLRQYDSFGDNVEAQHTALLSVCGTAQELLAEFKRSRKETAAFMAAIPAAVVARKHTWWTLCFQTLQPPLHDLAHVNQMRLAIEAYRAKPAQP